ncbi:MULTISPECIES: putative quinol monooxygenase [unclassified Aeromicrobium]|uniref:putative quinol monooxygenase n=1 Tax=unclassified Aeromicrobium TaxID=2633570 RepID=UPI002097F2B2|nr:MULTISPECIES: antibiotic biosynthesis monooxygenase family protein [unclassified Aeromicrobium]MCO7238025.1 antibiotic biosynthesis monooxygenase [Aeromicrobium sp. CnD17-E]MDR6119398.1 quinol monooxygenase YgiN [Aeromicrobium sp. SORGH_AS_0981]
MTDSPHSVVVAGWLRVEPARRDAYVAACRPVVELARGTDGCLAFALTADSVDPGLVVVHEHWRDEVALLAFRALPDDEAAELPDVLDADVRRYHVQEEGPA